MLTTCLVLGRVFWLLGAALPDEGAQAPRFSWDARASLENVLGVEYLMRREREDLANLLKTKLGLSVEPRPELRLDMTLIAKCYCNSL